jgi:hypothetical protein
MKQNSISWLIAPMTFLLCVNMALAQGNMSKIDTSSIKTTIENSIVEAQIIPIWNDSSKNDEYRKNDGKGFSYEYNLPDAWGISYALYRTYKGSLNNGYILLDMSELSNKIESIRGRYKFSGSDIDQTKDTLIIAVSKYKKQSRVEIEKFDNGQLDKNDFYRVYTEPQTQFQGFSIDLDNMNLKKDEYLAIQFILKSGSDDNYYYGTSDAVIDNLIIGFKNQSRNY